MQQSGPLIHKWWWSSEELLSELSGNHLASLFTHILWLKCLNWHHILDRMQKKSGSGISITPSSRSTHKGHSQASVLYGIVIAAVQKLLYCFYKLVKFLPKIIISSIQCLLLHRGTSELLLWLTLSPSNFMFLRSLAVSYIPVQILHCVVSRVFAVYWCVCTYFLYSSPPYIIKLIFCHTP